MGPAGTMLDFILSHVVLDNVCLEHGSGRIPLFFNYTLRTMDHHSGEKSKLFKASQAVTDSYLEAGLRHTGGHLGNESPTQIITEAHLVPF